MHHFVSSLTFVPILAQICAMSSTFRHEQHFRRESANHIRADIGDTCQGRCGEIHGDIEHWTSRLEIWSPSNYSSTARREGARDRDGGAPPKVGAGHCTKRQTRSWTCPAMRSSAARPMFHHVFRKAVPISGQPRESHWRIARPALSLTLRPSGASPQTAQICWRKWVRAFPQRHPLFHCLAQRRPPKSGDRAIARIDRRSVHRKRSTAGPSR